jgi:hypothetical protein
MRPLRLTPRKTDMKKVTRKISHLEASDEASCQAFSLDLDVDLTSFSAIQSVDKAFIGSAHYLGLYPFWNTEYKYELRPASPKARRAVHHALLSKGKKLSAKSASIKKIIETTLSACSD